MYAETESLFPYFQDFSQEVQQFEEVFCCQQKPMDLLGCTLVQAPTMSDYNLWAGSDLFKAPEPIIEEPAFGPDPLTAAISMISCGEDAIPEQSMAVSDIESSIENGRLLSEVFYECQKDLLAKDSGNETPLSEVLKIEMPIEERFFQKSVSSACLKSMEVKPPAGPGFLDIPAVDFGSAYGMRRAFSEGDIKTLDVNGNISQVQSPGSVARVTGLCPSEERREKLSRYWSKKSRRNFDRKIKYACRKALADSQPRVRGRFAKTEASESCKKH